MGEASPKDRPKEKEKEKEEEKEKKLKRSRSMNKLIKKTPKLDYNVRRGQMPGIGKPEDPVALGTYHDLQAGKEVRVDEELAKWLVDRGYAIDLEPAPVGEPSKGE